MVKILFFFEDLLYHLCFFKHTPKCQIGFLPNNRMADHVFTLRRLIDKCVHSHNGKIYACLVDFRKAFNSVWHVGLLNKLLKINVGCFYTLIKRLYLNSTCCIKLDKTKHVFSFSKRCTSRMYFKPTAF